MVEVAANQWHRLQGKVKRPILLAFATSFINTDSINFQSILVSFIKTNRMLWIEVWIVCYNFIAVVVATHFCDCFHRESRFTPSNELLQFHTTMLREQTQQRSLLSTTSHSIQYGSHNFVEIQCQKPPKTLIWHLLTCGNMHTTTTTTTINELHSIINSGNCQFSLWWCSVNDDRTKFVEKKKKQIHTTNTLKRTRSESDYQEHRKTCDTNRKLTTTTTIANQLSRSQVETI